MSHVDICRRAVVVIENLRGVQCMVTDVNTGNSINMVDGLGVEFIYRIHR